MGNIYRVVAGLVVVIGFVLVAGSGELQADRKRETCTKAKPCGDCSTGNGCTRKCKGAGCAFKHSGGGGADFYCTSGKCTLDHTGAGGVDLWCKGGGCVLNHDGAGGLTLHCPGGGCTLVARGVGTSELVECTKKNCTLECHSGAGNCELDGVDVPPQ